MITLTTVMQDATFTVNNSQVGYIQPTLLDSSFSTDNIIIVMEELENIVVKRDTILTYSDAVLTGTTQIEKVNTQCRVIVLDKDFNYVSESLSNVDGTFSINNTYKNGEYHVVAIAVNDYGSPEMSNLRKPTVGI